MSGRLALAGVCALASLGLPWGPGLAGSASPARVFVVLATVLVAAGLRTGRGRLRPAAVAVGAVGVLVGGTGATPGRVGLVAAVALLVAALRAGGRPVPRRPRPGPAVS